MKAFALNSTLKPGTRSSSTDRILDHIGAEFVALAVTMIRARVADHRSDLANRILRPRLRTHMVPLVIPSKELAAARDFHTYSPPTREV